MLAVLPGAGPPAVRPATEAGRLCRSLLARLAPGTDSERLAESVARVTGTRLWQELLPDSADSASAARRRERELSRPVDLATGPGVRVVLLRYADAPAELVIVAHRAVAEPHSVLWAVLAPAAAAPVTADPVRQQEMRDSLAAVDGAEPPAWGLGRAGASGAALVRFTLPDLSDPRHTDPGNTDPGNTDPENTVPRETVPRETEVLLTG
ncbi:MAG: hypothetical protein JO144_09655, partial [Actinobacteria bacterium]|nr:hypothetical protein [Actinomycetota bacterium]